MTIQNTVQKIVIVGPESTGKSTLCAQLAKHYGTTWCPEYAREYLLQQGTDYTFDDLAVVAKGQLKLEEKYVEEVKSQKSKVETAAGSGRPLSVIRRLFIDTDMYVMKVWCEFVFNQCHPWILNQIVEQKYDLYLLCKPDLPWVKDELREYPDLKSREKLYHIYKDLLLNQPVPWVEINGDHEERLQKAMNAVDGMC